MTVTPERTEYYGGKGGDSFDDSSGYFNHPSRIDRVDIRSGSEVDMITITYRNGKSFSHGGGGGKLHTFHLAMDEVIESVSGRCGSRLDQISFHTSSGNTYGPYGKGGGGEFEENFGNGNALHYVFGRSGKRIDAIGFGYGTPSEPLDFWIRKEADYGGNGGTAFDELSPKPLEKKLTKICIRHGKFIDGIQFHWGNEKSHWQGGTNGQYAEFPIPDGTFLTQVRGSAGQYVDSLKFVLSNGAESPYYGGFGGGEFELKAPMESIINGFYGRSGVLLDSIGFYTISGTPVKVQYLKVTYDTDNILVAKTGKVLASMTASLTNTTDADQQVSQQETYTISESTSNTQSFKYSPSVEVTFGHDFSAAVYVARFGLTVGFQFSHCIVHRDSVTNTTTDSYTFRTKVPPHSTIRGTAVIYEKRVDINWTANVRIHYAGQEDPVERQLTGTLQEVKGNEVEAEFATPKSH